MTRTIVIGDIHGCYKLLRTLIQNRIVYNPSQDRLIFLGDYLDRKPMVRETVDYVTDLRAANPETVHLLKGNHEDMAYRTLVEGSQKYEQAWHQNGGLATIDAYHGPDSARLALRAFIESLSTYYEDEHCICVHAGIPTGLTLREATERELLWTRGFEYGGDKLLVVGHTIEPGGKVRTSGRVVHLDTGAYRSGVLSAYDVQSGTIYQAIEGVPGS